jgi:hypothetical protein
MTNTARNAGINRHEPTIVPASRALLEASSLLVGASLLGSESGDRGGMYGFDSSIGAITGRGVRCLRELTRTSG